RMFGMVNLGDAVDITVERVGRVRGGGLALDVTARCGDTVVSQASCTVSAPRTAYVYPGQGIQARGMTLDDRAASAAVREVWERADRHTRSALGFSILAV
ncbi:acyltransferase domain-containing protein, partial [Streptococcus anginosus]|nr:acyltransferase domain-containing protein [Streptococcus anginosus]